MRLRVGLGQQHADHHAHLRLVAVAGADDGLLDQVGRIFGDRHAALGRHQHGDAARLAELQRRGCVLVDEGRLDRGLVGPEVLDHAAQAVMDRQEAQRQRGAVVGRDRAAGHEGRADCRRCPPRPSRCGGGRDRCPGCESDGGSRFVHSRNPAAAPTGFFPVGPIPLPAKNPLRRTSAGDPPHVIAFPDSAALVAIAGDRRFLLAAAAAALSGMVRGFTGFGSALVFVPLVAAIYDPRIAAASLLLIDFTSGPPFAIQAAPRCDWHQVWPVAIAAAFGGAARHDAASSSSIP